MKKCSCCKLEKDENEFGKNKNQKDGLWCYCKKCVSEKGKIERAKRPEFYSKKSQKYRDENPIKYRECSKKTYEKHRDKKRAEQIEYYWRNREEIKKRTNERSRTPEFRNKAKEYRDKNREKIKKQHEAHQIVKYAIKLNVLKKSLCCELCGLTNCLIDGHHEDYEKPLEIKWVCRKCHRKLEKQEEICQQ